LGITKIFRPEGCSNKCNGCFNKSTWDFNGGYEFTNQIQEDFIKSCRKSYVNCISVLGGEPLDQDISELLEFLIKLKSIGKPIFLWSGYTFEKIIKSEQKTEILNYVDVLIDGKFIEKQKDTTLWLRGSSNQRIIDIKNTLKRGKIVLWES
jgi:anaerobic ribonucleoside-triphosphate reductase activating protein